MSPRFVLSLLTASLWLGISPSAAALDADLKIHIHFDGPDPVVTDQGAGDPTLAYTIRAKNLGPDDATGVTLAVTLPGLATFASASAGCAESAGVVTCALGDIPGGGLSSYVVVSVTVPEDSLGTIASDASVAGNETDPNPANDSSTEDTELVRENDPPVAFVRKKCGALAPCFGTIADLVTWIGDRVPRPDAPLLVDVGPGDWARIDCIGYGDTTFRGSGRLQTRVGAIPGNPSAGVYASGCDNVEFHDMTIYGSIWGVFWQGAGRSVWVDVDVVSDSIGWYDFCSGSSSPEPLSVHYWFGSRVLSTAAGTYGIGYLSSCGENWLYGSEVAVLGSASSPAGIEGYTGIDLSGSGDVRLFGSTVRVVPKADFSCQGTGCEDRASGVRLGTDTVGAAIPPGDGVFHMHGGIVSVDAAAVPGATAVGIEVGGSGLAHAPDTAFSLKPGTGGAVRRLDGAAQSPFQWPAGAAPPAAGALASEDGQDTYVETDCGAGGDCEGGGAETHLMIYNETLCGSADPWFDATTGRCRNDTGS